MPSTERIKGEKEKVKNILILVKTDKGIFEALTSEMVRKEIYKILDTYGIVLHPDDLSDIIKF